MQRTISAMVGKGSVNHNSRKFKADNIRNRATEKVNAELIYTV